MPTATALDQNNNIYLGWRFRSFGNFWWIIPNGYGNTDGFLTKYIRSIPDKVYDVYIKDQRWNPNPIITSNQPFRLVFSANNWLLENIPKGFFNMFAPVVISDIVPDGTFREEWNIVPIKANVVADMLNWWTSTAF